VDAIAERYGCQVFRTAVGEANVATGMLEHGCVIGGEGNGGVILPLLHLTRDASVGAALILQHLVDTGLPLSGAVARWPSYAIVKEKVDFERAALPDAYRALASDLEADHEDRADGLRLAWDRRRAWLHVRPSGTEPVVRLIAEAPKADAARELVRRARAVLDGVA
jgi:phosphomannomutase